MNVTIDAKLKAKCPRTALGCVTARVQAGASPAALLQEMKTRENEIQKLPFPRGVLESAQVETTRKAYKALGKDPARYRNSAEALLRRVVAGKGLPEINAVVDVINLVSGESRLPVRPYVLGRAGADSRFRRCAEGETDKGIVTYDLT